MILKLYISLVLIFFITGCNSHPKDDNGTGQVNQVIFQLIEADNKGDLRTIIDSYTDSVEFYPLERDMIKGIVQVRKNYEDLFSGNRLNLKTRIIETIITGNKAVVTGINRGTRTHLADSVVTQIRDKYTAHLVRNKSGRWKIDMLIWEPLR